MVWTPWGHQGAAAVCPCAASCSGSQTSAWGGLGQTAGPLLGSRLAGCWLCILQDGHELTVMEFTKPKPSSVENLFLISGRHLEAAAKCVRGVGGCRPNSQPGAQLRSVARALGTHSAGPGR